MPESAEILELGEGGRLAIRHRNGAEPGVLFCPGFHSDMQGEKALALDAWCRATGRQMTRFDYFGHGESGGPVEQGRIGRWAADTIAVLDRVARGRQLIVGSSMGGWMMLLAALARPRRVHALVGVASAPDFTRAMQRKLRDSGQQALLAEQGYIDMPSHYPGESSYRIEKAFLEEAEQHCLLDGAIALDVPIRLLHGQQDADVPWQLSLTLAERLASKDVRVCLVKDGDHRLSRPADIRLLVETVSALVSVEYVDE